MIKTVKLYGDMHRFIPAFASWMGVKVAEVPVKDRARQFGKSKYGFSRTFRVFLDLFTLSFLLSFQGKPMRLFGGMGVATGAIGVLILAYLAFIKVFEGALLSNRPILWLGVMLVILGVQFLVLRPAGRDADAHVLRIAGQVDLRDARSHPARRSDEMTRDERRETRDFSHPPSPSLRYDEHHDELKLRRDLLVLLFFTVLAVVDDLAADHADRHGLCGQQRRPVDVSMGQLVDALCLAAWL